MHLGAPLTPDGRLRLGRRIESGPAESMRTPPGAEAPLLHRISYVALLLDPGVVAGVVRECTPPVS